MVAIILTVYFSFSVKAFSEINKSFQTGFPQEFRGFFQGHIDKKSQCYFLCVAVIILLCFISAISAVVKSLNLCFQKIIVISRF